MPLFQDSANGIYLSAEEAYSINSVSAYPGDSAICEIISLNVSDRYLISVDISSVNFFSVSSLAILRLIEVENENS